VTNVLGNVTISYDDEVIIEHEIEDYEPFVGYFGFTAGTGGSHNWHIVDNVNIIVGGPDAELAWDRVEFGPVPVDEIGQIGLGIANRSDGEGEWYNLEYQFADRGEGVDWITFDHAEGMIEAGQEFEVTCIANTEGLELGEYEREIVFTSNDPNYSEVIYPATIFVVEGFGRLHGRVTDASDNSGVAGSMIVNERFGLITVSDDEGYYEF